MTYDIQLRKRVLSAYEAGRGSQHETCSIFQVRRSTFTKWLRKQKGGEDIRTLSTKSGSPRTIDAHDIEFIKKEIEKQSSLTLSVLSKSYFTKYHLLSGRSVLSY